jgi:hypothetical protein
MITPREDQRQQQDTKDTQDITGGPTIEEQDWDAIEAGEIEPVSVPENGDLRYADAEGQSGGELPGEDDDNPYQESDEALPDDAEEAAITRDPSKGGTRFDEV